MTAPRTSVIILESETVLRSWARDASTLALFIGLIGPGIYLQSSAMQWAGFFIAVVFTFAKAGNATKRMTINEARDFLDELDEGQ